MSDSIKRYDTTIVATNNIGIVYDGSWHSSNSSIISKHHIITRSDLRIFCESNEITKNIFDDLEERIPMGVDLLKELIKIGNNDAYVKTLIRERKLKSL